MLKQSLFFLSWIWRVLGPLSGPPSLSLHDFIQPQCFNHLCAEDLLNFCPCAVTAPLNNSLSPSCSSTSALGTSTQNTEQNPLFLPADLLLKKVNSILSLALLSPCPVSQQVPLGQLGHFLPLLPHWSQATSTFLSFHIFI